MDKNQIQRAVSLAVSEKIFRQTGKIYVPIAASARHIHLSQADVERLFGAGYELQVFKQLSQPGQFAAKEQVTVIGPKGKIERIRVLGPARKETQVEIALTDSFALGIRPPVRMSGELAGTPGCAIEGPKGRVDVPQGVIAAARHLHLSQAQADLFGLKNGQKVSVRATGERATTLHNVIVRCGKGHDMEVHIDTDEANAIGLKPNEMMEVIV